MADALAAMLFGGGYSVDVGIFSAIKPVGHGGNFAIYGGAMAALRRTETGGFVLGQCSTLEALEAMDDETRVATVIPTEALFAELAAVCLPAFYEKLCRSGCEIYLKKIGAEIPVGTRVRLCNAGGRFFALGEVREYESGSAVKAIKTFDIEG